jgi:hypothetical protein
MIDWIQLLANALWVLGCALALATLSYAHWQAGLAKIRFREQLGHLSHQIILSVAGVFFCFGLGLSEDPLNLTSALWFFLALTFLTNLASLRKKLS